MKNCSRFAQAIINERNVNICSYFSATFHKRMLIQKSKRFLANFAIRILKGKMIKLIKVSNFSKCLLKVKVV